MPLPICLLAALVIVFTEPFFDHDLRFYTNTHWKSRREMFMHLVSYVLNYCFAFKLCGEY